MRILSVIDSLGHGGAETVLIDLVLGLREHEHRVLHFSRANAVAAHPDFLTSLARRGIASVDAHWTTLRERAGRTDVLGGFRPDVVVFHWWGSDPWRSWIEQVSPELLGKRPAFVLVMHHAEYTAPRGYDRYVLVAESQREQVWHVPPERVRVIPNGIDLARFPARGPRGRADRHGMVVGRLSSLRGGKIAADWVDRAVSFGLRDARFVVAGDGPLRAPLARRASDLGVEDRFSFPGYVPRGSVATVLRGFDVYCYATSSAVECHPLALLEALAAGVPIVAEARGGIPAIVRHGENGLLASSVEEIGRHLHRLRRDDGLRARLGRGARRSAHRFSLDRQIRSMRGLLHGIREERAGGRAGTRVGG